MAGSAVPRTVTLDAVGPSIAAALAVDRSPGAGRPTVVVGCPGGTVDGVVAAARTALVEARSDLAIAEFAVLRSDRDSGGAFVRRNDLGVAATSGVVVPEAQWLPDDALSAIVELAATAPPGGPEPAPPLIVIHRHGLDRQAIGELRLRGSTRVIDVGLLDVDALVADGVEHAVAERLIARTGGAPDLVDLIDDDLAFSDEIVARLSVVDDEARRAAELLAFGLEAELLVRVDDAPGWPARVDAALGQLRVEGLLVGPGVPAGVATAVRAACPPGRRSALVETVVEHGPAGAAHDLAALLLDARDRSAFAGPLYVDAATGLATEEPERSLAFATAAVEAGIPPPDVAVPIALARLGVGDPSAAITALDDAAGPEAELARSVAWMALGDLASAADSAARSTSPPLGRWPELGLGNPTGSRAEVLDGSEAEAADRFAALLTEWWRADGMGVDEALDDLQRIATRARADRSSDRWPIAPELAAVLISARAGDLATAGRLAGRADLSTVHARTAVALVAWVEARRGHLDAAEEALGELADLSCSPHDRLVAAGARCAIAVREADGNGLAGAVADARLALDELAPHLHVLDVIADIAGAAARARVSVGDVLGRCERYADRDPDARASADVARARLVAALAGDDLAQIAEASRSVLDHHPGGDERWRRVAAILADPASADPAETVAVARELAETDASYEAARVCGVVALATSEADAARRLLRESRVWRATRRQVATAPGTDRSVVSLSEQEQRVGRMVLDGHTHKQVGAALFISPKTVEHHVAHIRTKLGCANRAEMMVALRDYLDGATA